MQAKFARKPGRPKGSKTKSKSLAPPAWRAAAAEIEHSDLQTLVDRQLVLAEIMQGSLREEIRRRLNAKESLNLEDVRRFETMTQALHRCFQTLKGSGELAEEMAARMTGQQLLQAAVDKLCAQEPNTVRWAIRVLRAHIDRTAVAPQVPQAMTALADLAND